MMKTTEQSGSTKNQTFEEALTEMEIKKEQETTQAVRDLDYDEVISIISFLSIITGSQCFMDYEGYFVWNVRKGELVFDQYQRELKLVDFDVDEKTQLMVEGVCARYELEYDWYFSESKRKEWDKKLKKIEQENGNATEKDI